MAPPTRLTRALRLLTAALQLALPVVLASADARLERASLSPRAASHAESHRSPQCPPVHGPDCALCQQLATPFARAAAAAPALVAQAVERVRTTASERPARLAWGALPLSRAPPLS